MVGLRLIVIFSMSICNSMVLKFSYHFEDLLCFPHTGLCHEHKCCKIFCCGSMLMPFCIISASSSNVCLDLVINCLLYFPIDEHLVFVLQNLALSRLRISGLSAVIDCFGQKMVGLQQIKISCQYSLASDHNLRCTARLSYLKVE